MTTIWLTAHHTVITFLRNVITVSLPTSPHVLAYYYLHHCLLHLHPASQATNHPIPLQYIYSSPHKSMLIVYSVYCWTFIIPLLEKLYSCYRLYA